MPFFNAEAAVWHDPWGASNAKRVTHLEIKTNDLENHSRRRNLRVFGLRKVPPKPNQHREIIFSTVNFKTEKLFMISNHRGISYTTELSSCLCRVFQWKRCSSVESSTWLESCLLSWEYSNSNLEDKSGLQEEGAPIFHTTGGIGMSLWNTD